MTVKGMALRSLPLMAFTSFANAAEKSFVDIFNVKPPEDISTHGHEILDLFNYTTTMNIIFFTLVCIGLFGFAFLYRSKKHPKAYFTYGNTKTQRLVATGIGIAVFLLIDISISLKSNEDLVNVFWKWPDPTKEEVVRVQVMAQQWAWNFRYEGEDGVFNTDDDIVTVNDLRVPAGKKVLFHITSKDVIHALYFPNTRLKVDAIPGRITRLWTDFNKPGKYDIACAEMCGTHHYYMKAYLTVYSPEEYLAWRDEARVIAKQTNDTENVDLYWGWRWNLTKK